MRCGKSAFIYALDLVHETYDIWIKASPKSKFLAGRGGKNGWAVPNWNLRGVSNNILLIHTRNVSCTTYFSVLGLAHENWRLNRALVAYTPYIVPSSLALRTPYFYRHLAITDSGWIQIISLYYCLGLRQTDWINISKFLTFVLFVFFNPQQHFITHLHTKEKLQKL